MRADAAAPAAPVGAHARARARIHEHRREPLYIRPARLPAPDRHPMLPRLDEHAPPTDLESQIFIRPRASPYRPWASGCRLSAGVQPPRCTPADSHTRLLAHQRRPVTDSLSVDPHCALRCLPLGACVGASESRCAAAALSTADRPARSRDRYDLLVASNPEALDDPITRARHALRARVLAVDRGGPRPR